MPPLLEFDRVCVRFGGVLALDKLSFQIPAGSLSGLIGPNGSGKTTLINCVSRLCTPASGDIRFEGRSLLQSPAHALARLGIARTFQNLALFDSMSVRDTILAGTQPHHPSGLLAHALALASVAREARAANDRAEQLIDELDLATLVDRPVKALSLGNRRRVELARALACAPRLLLLDEPASGLTVEESDRLAAVLLALRKRSGLTVLMIEHRMRLVSAVCDQVVALNFGCKVAQGTPDEVRVHPQVIEAWLGTRQ